MSTDTADTETTHPDTATELAELKQRLEKIRAHIGGTCGLNPRTYNTLNDLLDGKA